MNIERYKKKIKFFKAFVLPHVDFGMEANVVFLCD